jgi:hypothetical protein
MEPLNMTAIRSFETSGTDYPVAESHISEKRTPKENRCAKMKTRKSMPARERASKPQQETYMLLHSLGILTYVHTTVLSGNDGMSKILKY